MAETTEGQKKECFVIMPITTPDSLQDVYRDGPDHFLHVLDCLFVPSIEAAGYTAIRPTTTGSDVIQASIVSHLERADLVLCDMSALNPNVFFEFGVRTALNKPVCIVKDDCTQKIPFDTSILHYHEYKSSLDPWELKGIIGDNRDVPRFRLGGQNCIVLGWDDFRCAHRHVSLPRGLRTHPA